MEKIRVGRGKAIGHSQGENKPLYLFGSKVEGLEKKPFVKRGGKNLGGKILKIAGGAWLSPVFAQGVFFVEKKKKVKRTRGGGKNLHHWGGGCG